MSMWCEKCNKVNYSKGKCEHCGHIPNNTSPTYTVPKNKGAKVTQDISQNKIKISYMIPCDICGNDIAVKATSCPYCGDTKSKNLFWKIIKIIFIVIVVLFIIDIILVSMGIVFFDDIVKGVQKETTIMHQKTFNEFNKQIEKSLQIKPTTINLPNTYQSKLQEKERQRQLEIQRKHRELQRLQRESEIAKRKLKEEMSIQ